MVGLLGPCATWAQSGWAGHGWRLRVGAGRGLVGSLVGLRCADRGAPSFLPVVNLSSYPPSPKSPSGNPCHSRIFHLVFVLPEGTVFSPLPLVPLCLLVTRSPATEGGGATAQTA